MLVQISARTSRLWFLPTLRRWTWNRGDGPYAMELFFVAGVAFACGCIGWLLGAWLGARLAEARALRAAAFVLALAALVNAWAAVIAVVSVVQAPVERRVQGRPGTLGRGRERI